MKHILIAGKHSYIGDYLQKRLHTSDFQCDVLDMQNENWRHVSFAAYDAVVLVAGIAHQQETEDNLPLYDQVNHVLAVQTADKAKREGVKQFVFFSSMSVYGLSVGRIHADTRPNPDTAYGKSKWKAEMDLKTLSDDTFHIAVLRPPMIYGPRCKGNYPRLVRFVMRFRMLPKVKNERSMLYIETLCAFMIKLLKSGQGGLYFPQNNTFVSTSALVAAIAKTHQITIWQPRGLGWILRLASRKYGAFGKVFGSLTYDQTMSQALMPQRQPSLEETIAETEATQ